MSWLQTYRIDVYIFFIALLVSFWHFLPSQQTLGIDNRVIVGFCYLCGLIWIYLFNKTTDRTEDAVSQPQEMMSIVSHQVVQKLLPILIVLPAVLLFLIDVAVFPYLVYILIGGLYSYPIYKHIRIKNIFLLKNIWAFIDMFLPVWFGIFIYFPIPASAQFIEPLAAFGLFYIVGELIWDIRDTAGDRAAKVYTLPVVLGVPVTKMVGIVLLCVGLFVLAKYHIINYVVCLVLALYLLFLQPTSPRKHFHRMLYVLSGIIFLGVWL